MWRSLARFCKQGIWCSNTHLNSTGHVVCYLAADGKNKTELMEPKGFVGFLKLGVFLGGSPS